MDIFEIHLRGIPSHIIQPWHHSPQNVFPCTPHEIWLKNKINLQFQLYFSKGTIFFRHRKFVQKQEIWMEQPAILDHLVHFCVVAALLKGPFGPKIQSLKIDNCDALHETSFALLKWQDKTFIKSKDISWRLWYSVDTYPRNWTFFTKFSS